jgi:hypothetical protein
MRCLFNRHSVFCKSQEASQPVAEGSSSSSSVNCPVNVTCKRAKGCMLLGTFCIRLISSIPASQHLRTPICCDAAVLPVTYTALTKLELDEFDTIQEHDVLRRSLLQLSAGNAATAACLLPLTRLQELSLIAIEVNAMPAAELRQLSSLTSLTKAEFSYFCTAGPLVDAAAGGWSALPLQHLSVQQDVDDVEAGNSLQRSTLLQLSTLTGLQSLSLEGCGMGNIRPEMLADVLGQLMNLQELELEGMRHTQQQQPAEEGAIGAATSEAEEDAAAGSFLTRLLKRLSSKLIRMQLWKLSLKGQNIGRAEAAALASMEGLAELRLSNCDLEDCCVADFVFAMSQTLDCLDISSNPRVTDASLPVRLVPSMRQEHLRGTGVTLEGLRQYLPRAQ